MLGANFDHLISVIREAVTAVRDLQSSVDALREDLRQRADYPTRVEVMQPSTGRRF